uniref:beta-catenin-interacting protein 1 isoform X1 n=2 Tax=Squalomorphii TaxID=118040 RepID=UPI00398E9186
MPRTASPGKAAPPQSSARILTGAQPAAECYWRLQGYRILSSPHVRVSENRVTGAEQMNREGAHGKTPEEMYIQQKVRVLLMLRKMGSNLTPSEEAFLRTYAGVVNSQLSQLPQHPIDQGAEDVVMAFSRQETEDRRQ